MLALKDSSKDKLAKFRWLDVLTQIITHNNNQLCPGSKTFKRNEIKPSNFLDYLDESKGEGKDFTMRMNSRSLSSSSMVSKEAVDLLFKFKVGDAVMISRHGKKRGQHFVKTTKSGAWDGQKMIVKESSLKPTSSGLYNQGKFSYWFFVFPSITSC